MIARAIGAQLTDVTCGGAETGDFSTGQHPGVAPQLEALGRDTQLVTMTIGGNDSGAFIDSVLACSSAGLTTLGQGSPCKDRFGSSFTDTVRSTTFPALVEALRAVRTAAPEAGSRSSATPDRAGRRRLLRPHDHRRRRHPLPARPPGHPQRRGAAEGHDACQPIGVRWIEPVLQGLNPVIVHPNALGEAEMAAHTMAVLRLDRR